MNQAKCKLCGTVEATFDELRSHFRNNHTEYFKKVKAWLGPDKGPGPQDQLYTEPRRGYHDDGTWIDLGNGGYRRKKLPPAA